MNIFKTSNKFYAILNISIVLTIIFYIIGNLYILTIGTNFKNEIKAESYIVEYQYSPNYFSNYQPIDGTVESSLFIYFDKDGNDMLISANNNTKENYNKMNASANNFLNSSTLFLLITLLFSVFTMLYGLFKRYYIHGSVLAFCVSIVTMFAGLSAYLNMSFGITSLIMLIGSLFLIKRQRFCDFDENYLLGIFKKYE